METILNVAGRLMIASLWLLPRKLSATDVITLIDFHKFPTMFTLIDLQLIFYFSRYRRNYFQSQFISIRRDWKIYFGIHVKFILVSYVLNLNNLIIDL